MRDNMEKRACELAVYIIEHRTTIRAAARVFGVSKSTVHKDLTQRLALCNHGLYLQVKQVLEVNKAERHIRGGLATRNKYRRAGARNRGQPAPPNASRIWAEGPEKAGGLLGEICIKCIIIVKVY